MFVYTAPITVEVDWEQLAHAITSEPSMLASRNTALALKELYEHGASVLLGDASGTIIGHLGLWPVAPGFYELGSVWIHPEYRNMGLSRLLYEASVNLPVTQQGVVFGITKNPIALKAGDRARLVLHENWNDPVPFHLTCEPCDVVDEAQKEGCVYRNTSCWLRFMKC